MTTFGAGSAEFFNAHHPGRFSLNVSLQESGESPPADDSCRRPGQGDDMNFSAQHQPTTLYVPVICIPILVVLCTVGNALNIWILSWHCPSGLKKALLVSLAISDTFVIWSAVPRYLNNNSEILGINLLAPQWSFLMPSYGVFSWIQYTFTYVSDWILVAFSMERLFVFRYKRTHRLHNASWGRAVCLIVGFVIISGATTSGTLPWYYSWWNNRHAPVYNEPQWIAEWSQVQDRIDIVFPIVVAFCLLGINSWLLIYLKRQMSIGKSLLAKTSSSADRPTKGATSSSSDNLTRMLLGCVALYFVTQLPAVILNTLDHFSSPQNCLLKTDAKQFWQPVVGTIALVNYSVNFFVYLGMSAKFRNTALQLCQQSPTYGTFRAITSSFTNSGPHTRNSSIFSAAWRKDPGGTESHVTLLEEFTPKTAHTANRRSLPVVSGMRPHSNTLEVAILVPQRKSF